MVNFNEVKFIFFHIPKCGGTSFREILFVYFKKIYKRRREIYLSRLFKNFNLVGDFNKINNHLIKYKLNNIKVILSHCKVKDFPALMNDKVFKFTIIRNPIDRLISHYYFFDIYKYRKNLLDHTEKFIRFYSKLYGNLMTNYLNLLDKNKKLDFDKLKYFLKNFHVLILEDYDLNNLNKELNRFFRCNNILKLKYINKNNKKNLKVIVNLYKKYLDRFPDKKSLVNYNKFLKKNSIDDLIDDIKNSEEYKIISLIDPKDRKFNIEEIYEESEKNNKEFIDMITPYFKNDIAFYNIVKEYKETNIENDSDIDNIIKKYI